MKYSEVLERIRFATNTTNDLSGKVAQPLFTNRSINQQLKFALDKYASYTKSIESIYSSQAYNTGSVVTMPSDILRSQGMRYVFIYNKGLRYPMIEKDPNNIYANFYVQNLTGIPGWFLFWGGEVTLYPINNVNPTAMTLLNKISDIDTTIPLSASAQIAIKGGRITIGDEKIYYSYMSRNTLYQCQRGIEGTVPVGHDALTPILENNVHVLYRKLHWSFEVPESNVIDPQYANREMEIPDEHIEVICDNVAYKLLIKVSPERAVAYKTDFDQWLEDAKYQIQKGRSEITKSDEVRDGYWCERDTSAYRYW